MANMKIFVTNMLKAIVRRIVPYKIRRMAYYIHNLSNMLPGIEHEINNLRNELLYLKIMEFFKNSENKTYNVELDYLKTLGAFSSFPYECTKKQFGSVSANYDYVKNMPFVLHHEKRLYYPRTYNIEQAIENYKYLITRENILGDGYIEKAPHQYITHTFCVQEGDIVLDLGAAEGLFLLDVVDKARKGYLFEPDKNWAEALKATFGPYENKVQIVEKYASEMDTNDGLTIDTCLINEFGNIFIKMDVEGCEHSVLNGAKSALTRSADIRVACCVYHNKDDAYEIEQYFNRLGYKTEFSDGYILFSYDNNIKPPYFRKGVIRAYNNKEFIGK